MIVALLDPSLCLNMLVESKICVLGSQVLKYFGPETMVTHEISAQTAGNLIGQRDFLSIRHSCKHKSSVYLGGAAIELESFPPQTGFVR